MADDSVPRNTDLSQSLIYARDLNITLRDLRKAHHTLKKAYLETIHCLAMAVEFRDSETGGHIRRIGLYSLHLARKAGLAADSAAIIRYAAPMHDIGKIGIPDRILQKAGQLDPDERAVMESHCEIGGKILAGSESDVLRCARTIAMTHHEHWDGSGYPRGLAGTDIPLAGRIVAIVDVFDALTSQRPYKEAFPIAKALTMISALRGNHFDPDLTDLLIDSVDEMIEENGDDMISVEMDGGNG